MLQTPLPSPGLICLRQRASKGPVLRQAEDTWRETTAVATHRSRERRGQLWMRIRGARATNVAQAGADHAGAGSPPMKAAPSQSRSSSRCLRVILRKHSPRKMSRKSREHSKGGDAALQGVRTHVCPCNKLHLAWGAHGGGFSWRACRGEKMLATLC